MDQFRKVVKFFSDLVKKKKEINKSHPKTTPNNSSTKPKLKSQIEKETEEIEKYSEFLKDFGDNFEQKRAVISDHKRILVLAGAGSGKTKVLTKRFIHLVRNKGVSKDDILAVTFTREAAKEMAERIAPAINISEVNLKKNVRTFHSFCLSILKQNEQFDIVDDNKQREIIEKIVASFSENEEIMESMYLYIINNSLEKVLDSENWREKIEINEKSTFGQKRYLTKEGVPVRSKSERDIANFLTFMGVRWKYEQPVTWADFPFKPDFTINEDIYLEHWGINDQTQEFNDINKADYLKIRKDKEEQYKKHHKNLIAIEENEMFDLQKLQTRLRNEFEGLNENKLKEENFLDMFNLPKEYKKAYEKFIEELIEIINLIKSRLLEINDVKIRLKSEVKEKVVWFYNVLIPVMAKYEEYLESKDFGKKDFNDLIKDAVNLLKNNPSRREYYKNKIKYLLVDEYQDVSYGEVELLKLLIDDNTSLFVVGDDWQSIYGWRGSDVDYILNFERDFSNCEKIVLPINYRSTKNIVDASSYFIHLSKKIHKKNIRCSQENEPDRSKVMQINAKNDFQAAEYVVRKIRKLMTENPDLKQSDFLILARSSRITLPYRKTFAKMDFKIPIRTIHWSKGTESRYVFVLGLKSGMYGFPNIYADKEIKRVIMEIPVEDKEEEERRLFYVAMTRAKKKLFLMSENGNESAFVSQIPEDYKFIYPKEVKTDGKES